MSRDASDDDGYDHAPTRASDDEDEPRTMSDEDDEEEDARRMRNLNLDEAFEPVTSPVMRLKRAWVRERLAPEMMTREDALVEAVKTAVEAQERALTRRAETRAERGGGAEDASEKLMDNVMWVEVNRIKYLLREYARTRLRKIEAHAFYFMRTEEGQERLSERLSEAEQKYVWEYANAVREHYENVLKELPDGYRHPVNEFATDEEGGSAMISKPKTDSFVFFRFREDVVNFVTGEDDDGNTDSVDLKRGAILLAKYSMFKDLLHTDPPKAELV
tara:strand:- start:8450 stop:9274 length:825 start_codon:yes stop_codon:yes gene_type:complete